MAFVSTSCLRVKAFFLTQRTQDHLRVSVAQYVTTRTHPQPRLVLSHPQYLRGHLPRPSLAQPHTHKPTGNSSGSPSTVPLTQ
jgi:hypothetical protein